MECVIYMKKNSGMTNGLNKSTKVTLLSCASFIVLTMLILIFFVMFPITPSEKIMASIGRENVFNGGNGNQPLFPAEKLLRLLRQRQQLLLTLRGQATPPQKR